MMFFRNTVVYCRSDSLIPQLAKGIVCILIAWAVLCISGCGSGDSSTPEDDPPPEDICTVGLKNKFVYDVMTDGYLWYDKVPETEYASYESPEKLLKDLMYKAYDRWSYISNREQFYAYYTEGKYIGAGLALGFDSSINLRLKYVHADSPAGRSGLKRGDKIIRINGKTPAEISQESLWNEILGPDDIGVALALDAENSEGAVRSVTLKKDWVTINTVLHDQILTVGDRKIAYLVFTSFLSTSVSELDRVFAGFRQEGAEELILDLRYNSGGMALVSLYLANLISGDRFDGEVFVQFIHNNKYSHLNHFWLLSEPRQALSLKRLFVISTRSTCSASEMIINGLSPYIDVILIGDATCGKPVGMYGHDYCDIHLSPVEFRIANVLDQGDYFWGIAPECFAEDDLSRNFGDPEEASLKQTLGYIETGTCVRSAPRKDLTEYDIPMTGLKWEIGAF